MKALLPPWTNRFQDLPSHFLLHLCPDAAAVPAHKQEARSIKCSCGQTGITLRIAVSLMEPLQSLNKQAGRHHVHRHSGERVSCTHHFSGARYGCWLPLVKPRNRAGWRDGSGNAWVETGTVYDCQIELNEKKKKYLEMKELRIQGSKEKKCEAFNRRREEELEPGQTKTHSSRH